MDLNRMAAYVSAQVASFGTSATWNGRHTPPDVSDAKPWAPASSSVPVPVTTTVNIAFIKSTNSLATALSLMIKTDVPEGTRKAYVSGPAGWQPQLGDTATLNGNTYSVSSVDNYGPTAAPMAYVVTFKT